jgi:hypothetical protein
MHNIPVYIPVVFIFTGLLTLFFLYKASGHSKILMVVSIVWLLIQAAIGLAGFYQVTDTVPPRFLLAIAPPVLAIILLLLSKKGRSLVMTWDLRWMTILHVVRIPVELVLFWLFTQKAVPQLMTFEGNNFDIISGISAPLILWAGFRKGRPNKALLLAWNSICLLLLINIVVHAILSSPVPFQQFAFDQPNIAVLFFPYVWLPAFVVPVVLLMHLVAIIKISIGV